MPGRTGPRYPFGVSRGFQLAYVDACARSTGARIVAVEPADGPAVVLDRTMFSSTCEAGPIRVTGCESKGRINKRIRIELAAG
jgi:Ser-tRNA(Ala) deacylase AlaX